MWSGKSRAGFACLAGAVLWTACATTPSAEQASAGQQQDRCAGARSVAEHRPAPPRQPPDECLRRVQQRLDAFCAARGCPGATVGFVLADGCEGAIASGVSHQGSGRPMKPTDRMFSGSIGKTYVAALLLQLLEEGGVELDARISLWFGEEEWFARLPNSQDITLRMLLNHTSGIARHLMMPEMQARIKAEPQKVWRPEELLTFVLDVEPLFPAGQGWSYADTNYILVGMIIERVTGRTYYQALSDRILTPLKLADTSPSDRPDLPGLVSGYTAAENIFSLPPEVASNGRYAMNPQLEWTGGGLVTTALDLARWARLLYGGDVLQDTSLQRMLDGVAPQEGFEEKYGLGAMIRPTEHGLALGHSGWVPGYVSTMWFYADHRIAVAAQINTDIGLGRMVMRTLADGLAGELVQPD
jgi:D-alanyl-D-alanine carboxypeptidase